MEKDSMKTQYENEITKLKAELERLRQQMDKEID